MSKRCDFEVRSKKAVGPVGADSSGMAGADYVSHRRRYGGSHRSPRPNSGRPTSRAGSMIVAEYARLQEIKSQFAFSPTRF